METCVEQLIEPGDVNGGDALVHQGKIYVLCVATVYRVGLDGTYEVAVELDPSMHWRASCVHDGALWFSGEKPKVVRWVPGEPVVEIEVPVQRHTAFWAIASHRGRLWLGGREGQLFCSDGQGSFALKHTVGPGDGSTAVLRGGWIVSALVSTDEGLWIASKGLYLLTGEEVVGTSVRSSVDDVCVSSSGAVITAGRGTKAHRGMVWRREPGKARFTKSVTPGTAWMVSLAQLDDGRIVCAGRDNRVFLSEDDGRTFTELPHPFKGLRGSDRDFESAISLGDNVLLTGMIAPVLLVGDGVGAASEPPPRPPAPAPFVEDPSPEIAVAVPPWTPALTEREALAILDIAADGDHVVAVGGGEKAYVLLHSTDGGQRFESRVVPNARGLRAAWVSGDEIWVAGFAGFVAHSTDRGESWRTLETGTRACLTGVARDPAGTLWIAGNRGTLARILEGVPTPVQLPEDTFVRFSPHPDGLLLTTGRPGRIYLLTQGAPRRLDCVEPGFTGISAARRLASGTILALAEYGIVYRSTDGGASFSEREGRVMVREASASSDSGYSDNVAPIVAMAQLPDGRVVFVGKRGVVLVSGDEGQSFVKAPQSHTRGNLWCCTRVGDTLLLGGDGASPAGGKRLPMILRFGASPFDENDTQGA